MKNFHLIIIAALTILASCAPKKVAIQPSGSVVPFTDTVSITPGSIIYALPLTVFELDITLLRTIEKPGPYASFAADLIGVSDIITYENEIWTLQSVSLKPLQELDPSEYYVLRSNSVIRTGALSLMNSGLILDIANSNMIARQMAYSDGDHDYKALRFNDMGSTDYFAVQRDTAYRVVNADTTFIRIPYLVESRRKLTNEQLAERAAKSLMELREGRHLILTGEATVFPQSEAPINEINRMEKEYFSLFAGKSWSETINMKIYYTPEQEGNNENAVLFRLSELTGVTDVDDSRGIPVMINLSSAGKTKPLVLSADLQMMTSAPSDGLVYRIPEVVDVRITEGNRNVLRTRTVVHQYGQKVILPMSFIPLK